jgi:thermitase
MRWLIGLVAVAAMAPAASGAEFASGSLVLGHPALHSERRAVPGGVVTSGVPSVSRVVSRELLVTFRRGTSAEVRSRVRARVGVTLVGSLLRLPIDLVRVGAGDRGRAIAALRAERAVRSVQPDAIERPDAVECPRPDDCLIPDDPGFAYQWYLYNHPGVLSPPGGGQPIFGADVEAPLAWSVTRGIPVRVAVIDTGIDARHPDLAGKVVAAANFTASNTTSDLSGHGTHVAGVVAASFDNAVGIAGMAPRAQLMDVKVLAVGADGRTAGDCADVADGILWATDHGANVLNLSLGSSSPCQAMVLAINYAVSHGALPIAAAGNDGSTSLHYPAALAGVVSVAATTNSDRLASFSNRSASWVDVAAPGSGILSTLPTFDNASGAKGYGYLSGTSMATPIVSGIAALIWSLFPAGDTNRQVEQRLFATADPIAGTGSDWRYGRVDACRAVTGDRSSCVAPPPTRSPAPQPTPPPTQIAHPSPVQPPPPSRNAIPGTYAGLLGRRDRPLRLTVGDGGDALIGFQGTVRLRCQQGPETRVKVAGLSTTAYAPIKRGGKFALTLRKRTSGLRNPRIRLAGSFDVKHRRAGGTLRVTGSRLRTRCDTRTIAWSARLTRQV